MAYISNHYAYIGISFATIEGEGRGDVVL